ncbi:hypothetical protein Vretimale_18410, partial [Volvox reticuliferus]
LNYFLARFHFFHFANGSTGGRVRIRRSWGAPSSAGGDAGRTRWQRPRRGRRRPKNHGVRRVVMPPSKPPRPPPLRCGGGCRTRGGRLSGFGAVSAGGARGGGSDVANTGAAMHGTTLHVRCMAKLAEPRTHHAAQLAEQALRLKAQFVDAATIVRQEAEVRWMSNAEMLHQPNWRNW